MFSVPSVDKATEKLLMHDARLALLNLVANFVWTCLVRFPAISSKKLQFQFRLRQKVQFQIAAV